MEIEHVNFSYTPDRPLIEDLNLSVKPGERVAIVGPTGCGKTTVINLLMRFYDVNSGSIKVEGKDIRDVTRKSLRTSYGMVLQETWLKSGTIRDNIAYGRPEATEEEIINAAKEAHAHSFIMRMPQGYDTVISEDGGNLSQGQKQLLCIARVMLCLPPMLILDEATSSIDTRTEIRVQKAFAKMMEGRTSFIVAHRLSTIREADVILVSDTSMVSAETPSLTTGLRGLAYWEIEVTGPNRDLHSGHFGGAVANPINVLCKLMADITDADGRITIPGFYDDVEDVSPAEREMIAQIPFDEAKYKAAIGVDELFGEKGYSTLERNSCRPSFDICGIWGGYMEEGSKTVLPSKAYAKVSCRLVPHQDHEKISKLFEEYIARVAPAYVKVRVTPKHGGQGYVCPIDLPAYKAAEEAVAVAFGKRPLAVRRGGSIPIISTFEQVLGIKTVLMGFGLEQNAIHSPNESCTLDFFYKGIESVAEFYKRFN